MQSLSQSIQTDKQTTVTEEKEEAQSVTYLKLITSSIKEEMGSRGMLQHQFASIEDANALADWLKKQNNLKSLHIDKAKPETKVIDNETVYTVRVSEAQHSALLPNDEFKSIQSYDTIAEMSHKITDALKAKDYELFNNLLSNPIIKKSRINQNRLMRTLEPEIYNENLMPNMLFYLFHNQPEDKFIKSFIDNIHPEVIRQAYMDKLIDEITDTKFLTKEITRVSILALPKFEYSLHPLILDVLGPTLLKKLFTSYHQHTRATDPNDPKTKVTLKIPNLLLCYLNMNSDQLNMLLKKLGMDTVLAALKLSSDPSYPGLSNFLGRNDPASENFLVLLKFLGPEIAGKMLYLQPTSAEIYSIFNKIVTFQPKNVLTFLMEFVSSDDLGKAINFVNSGGLNGLFNLMTRSSDEAFMYAYNKISEEDRTKAITFRAYDNSTVLHEIPKYRSEEVLKMLVNVTTPEALNACCLKADRHGKQVIDWFFLYLSPQTIVALLEKISYEAIESMLKPSPLNPVAKNYINKIAEGILNEPAWQQPTLIENMFKLIGQQLAPIAINHWNMGKPLSPLIVKYILANYTFSNAAEEKAFRAYKPVEWYQPNFEEKVDNTPIITSLNKSLLPTDNDFVETIWREGLADWSHYRRLKSIESTIPHLNLALETLYLSGRVTTGAMADYISTSDSKEDDQLRYIIDRTQEENTLIKIIKDKDWPDFFKQISDYSYRSPLRKPVDKSDKENYTHKYVHMTEEIVPYEPKRKTKTSDSTKKTSATLISKLVNTAVFGEHDRDRDLVGILINMAQCKVKAMLTQDKGTFSRNWIGTENQAKLYKEKMQDITFSDVNKFRDAVRSQPHRLNELLVKIKREAIMSIVMVTDSMEARAVAVSRQNQLEKELKIHVPIVFYDRPLRKMRLFLPHNKYLENELKNNPEILVQKAMLSSKDFLAYINLISKEVLGSVVAQQSKVHRYATALHIVAASQDDATFLAFIAKLPREVFSKTVGLKDENDISVLEAVAANKNSDTLMKFAGKFPYNSPEFQLAFTGKVLQAIIKNHLEYCYVDLSNFKLIPAGNLMKQIIWQDSENNNALHLAAKFKKLFIFNELHGNINWMHPAHFAQNNKGETPLHILASLKENNDNMLSPLLYFIASMSNYENSYKQTLSAFLTLNNINNESIMHIAVKNLNQALIDNLIDNIPPDILNKISETVTKDNKTILDLLFDHQELSTIFKFLLILDDDTLSFLLFHGKNQQSYIMQLSNAIIYESHKIHNVIIERLIIEKLFSHPFLGPTLFQTAESLWLKGNELPSIILTQFKSSQANYPSPKLNSTIVDLELELKDEYGLYKKPLTYDLHTSLNNEIDIKAQGFLETIWHEGLQSWHDYHILRKIAPGFPGLTETLDHLDKMERVLTGSYQPFLQPEDNISKVSELIKNSNALVKMIDEADWLNNLNKLIDHTFVPQGELIPEMKEDSYEYHFDSESISHYVPQKKQENSDYAQPTIARLLSSDFNSILINTKMMDNPQVGLLFDFNTSNILAMLMNEGHLKPGSNIGSKTYINDYVKEIQIVSFTNWHRFANEVRSNPLQANEVLMRNSNESLAAIIIANDSPQSREVARDRHQQIIDVLNINLPVVFYNSTLRQVKLYTPLEMLEDQRFLQTNKLINISAENEYKVRLLALKTDIENTSVLKKFSLFGSSTKQPGTAEAIKKLITEAEKNPNTMWSEAANKVKNLLSNAIEHPSKTRKIETQEFYKTEMKKYF